MTRQAKQYVLLHQKRAWDCKLTYFKSYRRIQTGPCLPVLGTVVDPFEKSGKFTNLQSLGLEKNWNDLVHVLEEYMLLELDMTDILCLDCTGRLQAAAGLPI